MQPTCDVLVVGGGVAGAALAFLLHRHGRQVVLVERGNARLSGPYETLLAPSRSLLARTGLAPLVEAGAEPDTLRHGAIWGGDTIEWRAGDEGGLLLRRGAFDRALRARVASDGVTCCEPAEVSAVDGAFRITTGATTSAVHAPHCAIAVGRTAGAVGASLPPGPARMLAFTFVGEALAEDRGTAVVEALPAGWVWTHAPHQGLASAVVFVDAAEVRDVGRDAFLAAVLRPSLGPAGRLRDRRLLHATDATSRWHDGPDDELRLGDAAATIDPLASQGVEKALAAADHAAAVLLAVREQPSWWRRLCAVHRRWERGLWQAHRQVADDWYRRETRFAAEPFWRRRQPGAAPPTAGIGDEALLRVSPDVQPARILVREGMGFAERDGYRDRRSEDERSHVGYVPIAPLLALFAEPRTIAAAVPLAGRDARLFVLPPRAVHGALADLVRRGWLMAATTAAGSR